MANDAFKEMAGPCSFCGKRKRLVTSGNVGICVDCIEAAYELTDTWAMDEVFAVMERRNAERSRKRPVGGATWKGRTMNDDVRVVKCPGCGQDKWAYMGDDLDAEPVCGVCKKDEQTIVGLRNLMGLLHDKSDTYFEQHLRDALALIERLRLRVPGKEAT